MFLYEPVIISHRWLPYHGKSGPQACHRPVTDLFLICHAQSQACNSKLDHIPVYWLPCDIPVTYSTPLLHPWYRHDVTAYGIPAKLHPFLSMTADMHVTKHTWYIHVGRLRNRYVTVHVCYTHDPKWPPFTRSIIIWKCYTFPSKTYPTGGAKKKKAFHLHI